MCLQNDVVPEEAWLAPALGVKLDPVPSPQWEAPRGFCRTRGQGRLLLLTVLFLCHRHPVRYISFNSHSLITANVPYEKVLRNSDLDNFACHRRSVWGWVESART